MTDGVRHSSSLSVSISLSLYYSFPTCNPSYITPELTRTSKSVSNAASAANSTNKDNLSLLWRRSPYRDLQDRCRCHFRPQRHTHPLSHRYPRDFSASYGLPQRSPSLHILSYNPHSAIAINTNIHSTLSHTVSSPTSPTSAPLSSTHAGGILPAASFFHPSRPNPNFGSMNQAFNYPTTGPSRFSKIRVHLRQALTVSLRHLFQPKSLDRLQELRAVEHQ